MTTNLTYIQIITFKLSFPFVNMSSLIQIPSRIKTPNTIEFMDIDDYKIYEKQQYEIYEKQQYEIYKNTIYKVNKILISDDIMNILGKHRKFNSYYLLQSSICWYKNNN